MKRKREVITLGVPSKGRPEMLRACLESITKNECKIVVEAVLATTSPQDMDRYTDMECLDNPRVFGRRYPDKTVIECQNMAAAGAPKHFLPISDDILLEKGTLDAAYAALKAKFPDSDGIIGLNQFGVPGGKQTAFMLIGSKFLDRFPDRQPFYPGYKHFAADTELGEFAQSIGKFYFCERARVEHLHPCTGKREIDETHTLARRWLQEDHNLYRKRKTARNHWGGLNMYEVKKRERWLDENSHD